MVRGRWWQNANIILPACSGSKVNLNHVVIGSICCRNSQGDSNSDCWPAPQATPAISTIMGADLKFVLRPLHASQPPCFGKNCPGAAVTQDAAVWTRGSTIRILRCHLGGQFYYLFRMMCRMCLYVDQFWRYRLPKLMSLNVNPYNAQCENLDFSNNFCCSCPGAIFSKTRLGICMKWTQKKFKSLRPLL